MLCLDFLGGLSELFFAPAVAQEGVAQHRCGEEKRSGDSAKGRCNVLQKSESPAGPKDGLNWCVSVKDAFHLPTSKT